MGTAHKILILGNSHTDAIKRAAGALDHVDVHWLRNKKSVHGDTDIETAHKKIAALGQKDCLVILHLGALHNIIGLLSHDQPFALLDAGGVPDHAILIPHNTLKAMMAEKVNSDTLIRTLAKKAPCRTYHVMSPPPKEELMMPRSPNKSYRGKLIQEMGFAPAPQRLAMWRLEAEVIRKYLEGTNILHIADIPGTRTEMGYLHPDYHAQDTTHANAAYGGKLLEHLRALMAHAPAF